MKVILIRAIRNLFVGQIELKPQPFKADLLKGTSFISTIELKSEKDKENNVFTLVLSESLLKEVCSVLLFEDEPDVETMEDMGTEVANQVIGNAKVLIESVKQESLHLSIPKVERGITLENVLEKPDSLKIMFKFNNDEKIWFMMSKETFKD
jgi:hypothetical protein